MKVDVIHTHKSKIESNYHIFLLLILPIIFVMTIVFFIKFSNQPQPTAYSIEYDPVLGTQTEK